MDAILKEWKNVDWDNLQIRLEGEVKAIEVRQEGTEERRKILVDESNKYRQNTDKESRRVAVPLIKAFQKEVDDLRQRERASESAFIGICQQLVTLPNPTAVFASYSDLQAAAARCRTAEAEAAAVKQQIADLTSEFADLQNQDVTIRQLRERVKQLEQEKEAVISESSLETERVLREEFRVKEAEMSEREERREAECAGLEKKLAELEVRMRDAQRRLDTSQAAVEQKQSVEAEQIEEMARELSEAHRKNSSLELEVARLNGELAEARANARRGSALEDIAALGQLMKEKDEHNSRLLDENRKLTERLSHENKQSLQKMERLRAEIERQRELVSRMQSELSQRGDYDVVKSELRALRELEFGEEAVLALEEDGGREQTVGEALKKLDKLMAEKNRRLQNENVNMRKHREEMTAAPSHSATELPESMGQIAEAIGRFVGSCAGPDFLKFVGTETEENKVMDEPMEMDESGTNLFTILLNSMNNSGEVADETGTPALEPHHTGRSSNNRSHRKSYPPSRSAASGAQSTLKSLPAPPPPPSPLIMAKIDKDDESITAVINGDQSPMAESVGNTYTIGNTTVGFAAMPEGTPPAEAKIIKELQMRVVSNVRSLSTTALNTGEIARQCKRLMVAYNIGQRLFAKFVMNQVVKSQGSLSELLSKPRHWSKLTDKGREAFRRIYGWISDPTAIELLCTLSPRRIQPGGNGEARIEHPTPESLWECNAPSLAEMMNGSSEDSAVFTNNDPLNSKRVASAKEDQYRSSGAYPAHSSGNSEKGGSGCPVGGGGSSKGSSRWRHDDIPKEKIINIFQAELAKLREQESSLERAINSRPSLALNGSGASAAHSSSVPVSHSNAPVGGGNSLKKLEAMALADGAAELPIQVNHAQQVMTLRIRSGLTPITQEQFEMFPNLNPDDVVRQIKDFLQVNGISQRQFGEFVLGLSQGSVSDLLARPKPWNQLTQKGREPFIRMKLFMRDVALAVEKDQREKARKEAEIATRREKERREAEAASESHMSLLNRSKIKVELEDSAAAYESEASLGSPVQSGASSSAYISQPETAQLIRRVKDRLHINGISQRDFGELVLGFNAGQTSDIFLRPKKWSQLSGKAREPYDRMRTWLADKTAITKMINQLKTKPALPTPSPVEGSSSNGRPLKRPQTFDPSSYENPFQNSSSNGSSNTVPPRKVQRSTFSRTGPVQAAAAALPLKQIPSKSTRRSSSNISPPTPRTIITEQQKDALRFVFQHEQHPNAKTVEQLSTKLGLHIRTVNNWFHNYRTRQKASMREGKFPAVIESFVTDKTGDWQKDLEKILDAAACAVLADDAAPTMVKNMELEGPVPVTVTVAPSLIMDMEDIDEMMDVKTALTSGIMGKKTTSSQLDKAVERMRILAASSDK